MSSTPLPTSDEVPIEAPAAPVVRISPADPPPAEPTQPAQARPAFTVRWRAGLREFAVIMAGVLCALGAQAWWEWRQERGRERDYLAQLLLDTRENERRLGEAIATDTVTRRAMRRLAGAFHAPAPLPPSDTLLSWMLRAGVGSGFQPLTGTHTALLSTGDLRILRNDTLRARVVEYAAALESETQRLNQFREVDIGLAGPMARALPFMRGVFVAPPSAAGIDWERLRADPELAGILFTLQAANANRVSGLERALAETRRMRRALEAEPGIRERGDRESGKAGER